MRNKLFPKVIDACRYSKSNSVARASRLQRCFSLERITGLLISVGLNKYAMKSFTGVSCIPFLLSGFCHRHSEVRERQRASWLREMSMLVEGEEMLTLETSSQLDERMRRR